MTRSIDQAPSSDNNQSDDNEARAQQPQSNIEAQQLKQNTRHSQAMFGEQPRERRFGLLKRFDIDNNPREKEKTSNAKKYIAIGVVGVAAVGIGGVYAFNEVVKSTAVAIGGPGVNTEGVADAPGVDLDNNTITLEQSRDAELGYAEAVLAEKRESSVIALESMGYALNPDYSEEASDKGLTDGFFVDLYSTWDIGATNKAEGDRILRSLIDEDTSSGDYSRYADMIGAARSPILAHVSEVGDSTKNFYSDNFVGADGKLIAESNGNAMRVLTNFYNEDTAPSTTGIVNQVVYQRVETRTADGERSQKWIIKNMVSSDNPAYYGDLRPLNSTIS